MGGLPPRQLQLLRLYGEGLCTKEIAVELGVSVKTVETHKKQLYQTMKFKSFAHLVKTAVAFGLTSLCLLVKAGTVNLVWFNSNGSGATNASGLYPNGVNIYFATNLSLSTNQWPLLVYIQSCPPGTNSFLTNLPVADYFFRAEFTNTFWNQALPFSSMATTPPLPTNLLTGFTVLNH